MFWKNVKKLKRCFLRFLFGWSILTKDFIFSSAMLLLFECNCVALTVRSFYTWRAKLARPGMAKMLGGGQLGGWGAPRSRSCREGRG